MIDATHIKRTTLILGGARSGKSAFAEKLVLEAGLQPLYVATGEAHDDEMRERIEQHQDRRGNNWITIEEPLELVDILQEQSTASRIILVDCLTLWLSNLMMANKNIEDETNKLTELMPKLAGPVVFVSNEVGMGLVPETPLGREFRDHAGRMNQRIADVADTVSFIVAGQVLPLKAT